LFPPKDPHPGHDFDLVYQQFGCRRVGIWPSARLWKDVYGPRLKKGEDALRVCFVDCRTHHEDRARKMFHDLSDQLQAIHIRHVVVRTNHGGLKMGNQVQRLTAVSRHPNHFDLRGSSEHALEKNERQRGIVHQEYTHRFTRQLNQLP
jgi:hypothetical protein